MSAPTTQTAHGYVAYSRGCRCDLCRDAKAAYVRQNRRQAAERLRRVQQFGGDGRHLVPDITHGYNGYQNHHCRCQTCTQAKAEAGRQRRARQRTAKAAPTGHCPATGPADTEEGART